MSISSSLCITGMLPEEAHDSEQLWPDVAPHRIYVLLVLHGHEAKAARLAVDGVAHDACLAHRPVLLKFLLHLLQQQPLTAPCQVSFPCQLQQSRWA